MTKDINFKIIVPSYNVEKWAEKNLNSILQQEYTNFEIYYTDDMSTDNTLQVVNKFVDSRINICVNTEKKFALRNIVEGIERSQPNDEDVIVLVDGDDWLYHKNVLDIVREKYMKEDVLLTYGSYIDSVNMQRTGNVRMYSQHVIENKLYRQDTWRATHLRTFKYKLWKNIQDQDLRMPDGTYFRMTWDLAMMFPMLEMIGDRFTRIEDVLYVYNFENPISDHNVSRQLQVLLENYIRQKPKYERIF